MPGITVLTAGCCEDVPQRHVRQRPARRDERLQRARRAATCGEVLGREVDVAEVAFRPASVPVSVPVRLPSSNGTRAMTATSLRLAGGEQLVLGTLIEDVVDDLDRSRQPRASAFSTFAGSQRLTLMPNALDQPFVASALDRPLPAVVRPPTRRSRRGTAAGRASSTPRFCEALLGVLADVVGGETSPSGVSVLRRPLQVLRRDLGRDVERACRVPLERLAEQRSLRPVTVRPRRVEEVAAELDRAVERRARLARRRTRSTRPFPTCRSRSRRPASRSGQTYGSACLAYFAVPGQGGPVRMDSMITGRLPFRVMLCGVPRGTIASVPAVRFVSTVPIRWTPSPATM